MANISPPPPYSIEDNYSHGMNEIMSTGPPMYDWSSEDDNNSDHIQRAQRFRTNARIFMGELQTPSLRTITYELPAQLERASGPEENKKKHRLQLTTIRKFFKGVGSGIAGLLKKGLKKQ